MPLPSGKGDQGQRYCVEVFQVEPEGDWPEGWRPTLYTNELIGAAKVAESFVTRPNWLRSRVIDRKHPSGEPHKQIGAEFKAAVRTPEVKLPKEKLRSRLKRTTAISRRR